MNALDIVRAGFTVGRRRNSYSTNNRNLNLGIILSRSQALPVSKKTSYLRGEDYAIYTPDFYSKICKGTKFIRIIPLSPKEANSFELFHPFLRSRVNCPEYFHACIHIKIIWIITNNSS